LFAGQFSLYPTQNQLLHGTAAQGSFRLELAIGRIGNVHRSPHTTEDTISMASQPYLWWPRPLVIPSKVRDLGSLRGKPGFLGPFAVRTDRGWPTSQPSPSGTPPRSCCVLPGCERSDGDHFRC